MTHHMREAYLETLLVQGIPINPETVIVRLDIDQAALDDFRNPADPDQVMAPMFNHLWVEIPWADSYLDQLRKELPPYLRKHHTPVDGANCVRIGYLGTAGGVQAFGYIVYQYTKWNSGTHDWLVYGHSGAFYLDASFHLILREQVTPEMKHALEDAGLLKTVRPETHPLAGEFIWSVRHLEPYNTMDKGVFYTLGNLATNVQSYLSREREVELIDHPRNVRRRFQRQFDKEPSPYIVIRPDKPRKVYHGQSTGQGPKRSFHTVRGHFRRVFGHPFIPDGIYFIHAHTRGGAKGEDTPRKEYHVIIKKEEN